MIGTIVALCWVTAQFANADFISDGLNKRFLVDLIARDNNRPLGAQWHESLLSSTYFGRNHQLAMKEKDNNNQTYSNATSMQLVTDMSGSNFFNYWNFFNYPDPTHGNVNYVSSTDARTKKNPLAYVNKAGNVVLAVDSTTKLAKGAYRRSVRLTSAQTWNKGQLLVLDAKHMPTGCATWPAFWTLGDGVPWPTGGEIDIVEGVNLNTQNQYTLHTTTGCAINGTGNATSTVLEYDCDVNAYGGANYGCGMRDPSTRSYGPTFNKYGGGLYATLWDDQGIRVWFFMNGNVPADLTAKTPMPSTWGNPRAFWPAPSTCDNMDSHFTNQTIVINTTLCGDWAGAQGVFNPSCPGTCSDYVANPAHFKQAYWELGSVRIYQ